MSEQKMIQIPYTLFKDVYRLIALLNDSYKSSYVQELYDAVQANLDAKIESLIARENFTLYKTAPAGSTERENFRNQYLESVGITVDFRSNSEVQGL